MTMNDFINMQMALGGKKFPHACHTYTSAHLLLTDVLHEWKAKMSTNLWNTFSHDLFFNLSSSLRLYKNDSEQIYLCIVVDRGNSLSLLHIHRVNLVFQISVLLEKCEKNQVFICAIPDHLTTFVQKLLQLELSSSFTGQQKVWTHPLQLLLRVYS